MAVEIPVSRLKRLCNPLGESSPWGAPVTRRQVKNALASGRLVDTPGGTDHAGRIAFLVTHKADDAIEVDVGVPWLGCHVAWPVTDGNHRLAAALYRGDEIIKADVGGCLTTAQELFGVDCDESLQEADPMAGDES